ncbi:MAG: nucleotidyltransferase [Planctomycetota bacterium]
MIPTLLVMAAGIGSRYGGLKQIDPVGPGGEAILDYSVYDALRAGFGKVIFIIRRDIEADFREKFSVKFEKRLPVGYVYQEISNLPAGISAPPGRKKPWGTCHAVLTAAEEIREPFLVINADDFYGTGAFRVMGDHLRTIADGDRAEGAMVGYRLRDTLSTHGSVARGVSRVGADGCLEETVELTQIKRDGDRAVSLDDEGVATPLSGDEIVSMNFWGFTPAIFPLFRDRFGKFIATRAGDPRAECYISTEVNGLVRDKALRMRVLSGGEMWFGVTYREDKPLVAEGIRGLIARGAYPRMLWS